MTRTSMPDTTGQLKTLVRNAAVAGALFDTDMRYLAWSKRWLIDHRLGSRNLLGVSHYEVFPHLIAEWKEVHAKCLAGSVENREAEPLQRADGQVDFVRRSIQPWYNERNEIGGLLIFAEIVTEQRRMEDALTTSERHLSNIFRESPVPLSVSDFETGRFLDVNRALLQMMRAADREQLVGRTSVETGAISAEDRERMLQEMKAHGRVENFIAKMRRLDGAGFIAELHVSSYMEGDRQYLLTSLVDITARQRAEEELAAGRAHYRALFEAANDAVFLHGLMPDGTPKTFAAVNNVAIERLGYSAEEFQALTPADIDAEGFAEVRRRALETLAAEGHATFEMVQVAKNGRSIPVEISSRRFVLGDEPFILSIARDLTARKRAEKEIAGLATAIEQAVETVVITDADARIVYANPAFETSTGYAVSEALGQNPRMLQGGKHNAAFYKNMWDVLTRGETWRGRLQNKRKDGTIYLEDASISPVRDESGKIVNYISLKLDVTRETELHAQLLQAQKMESIGRLAGGVAHDFNNLLTVINGYSKMALDGMRRDDPLCEFLEEIHKAGERAAGLTRQLLAFSRKQILEPRVLNLNSVLEEMRKMLVHLVGEDVELQFSFCAEAPIVHADPHQLQQVIMNLAINARDAMPAGGRITFHTGLTDADGSGMAVPADVGSGRYAGLFVSDTGMGMDEATKQRIFEPFFTTKESGRGTGLGLSIVQGVIVQSGGAVRVDSQPGEGTTFQIYLPAVSDSIPEVEQPPVSSLEGKETILVVEDRPDVRAFTAAALRKYGYRVMEAANADEALTICEGDSACIHLVLTDVVMPHIGGRELAARALSVRPETKVLFMSGYTDEMSVRNGSHNTEVNFLLKPFSPKQLAGKVREVLGEQAPMARVLVADDEEGVRCFLRKALESEDYEVVEAANGNQALRLAHLEHVNVVITDLVMPEREGIETIRALRKELPGVRIIATSGAFNGQFLGVAKLLGADAVLSKPFSPEALSAKVKEVLAAR